MDTAIERREFTRHRRRRPAPAYLESMPGETRLEGPRVLDRAGHPRRMSDDGEKPRASGGEVKP